MPLLSYKRITSSKVLQSGLDSLRGKARLWENARFIIAEVPLDPKEAKKILPCGLWLSNPATGVLFIANYTKTNFTVPYKETGLLINVRTMLGSGVHCCWMLVDDDTALIYGRELLGYPKKLASFTFDETGNRICASVTRRGINVLTMEGEKGQPQNPAPPVFSRKTFNVSGPGQLVGVNPIWLFRPREVIKESYSARVTLKISPSDYDPVSRLVAGDPLSGRIAVTDIPGTHYYLLAGIAGLSHFANSFHLRFR